MGQQTSTQAMITEVLRRIPEISDRSQILFYVNRGLRYFNSISSFSYNAKPVSSPLSFGPAVTQVNIPSDMDTGSECYIYTTSATPYPVRKARLDAYGIKGVMSSAKTEVGIPDHYIIVGRQIWIYPGVTGGITLNLIYTQTTAVLSDSGASYSLLPDDYDDLLIDFAECELKRIYRIVGWEPLWGRMMQIAGKMSDEYRVGSSLSGGTESQARNAQDDKVKASQ